MGCGLMSLNQFRFDSVSEDSPQQTLRNFIRRNGERLRSIEYIFAYSGIPQPTKTGRIIIVEAWNEGCLHVANTKNPKIAFARATKTLQHYYGKLLGVEWLAPTSYSTYGVSVSIFEGRLPYKRMQEFQKGFRNAHEDYQYRIRFH